MSTPGQVEEDRMENFGWPVEEPVEIEGLLEQSISWDLCADYAILSLHLVVLC